LSGERTLAGERTPAGARTYAGIRFALMFRALLIVALLPTAVTAQPLVITAPAAPGGGWDQTARAMQRVLAAIEPGASVQVDNVPGAAGTIGLSRFIQSERGNPGALLVTGLVMVSGVILNGSPVSLADTTPIARLTGEYEVIVVPSSSPFRTMGELVDAFKREPGSVSWGGGSAGGTDDLLVRLLAEQIGLPASSVNYIAFAGGGAALAAVLGGQLTAAVSGYAEFSGQIAAGHLRVLAVSAATPVAGIDAPTLRESGIALDLANWRAIVAPPGLSDSEQNALTERVARLTASPQWQATLAQNGWDDQFLTGAPLRQFLLAEQSRIEEVLRRLSATSATAPALAVAVTPSTLPNAVALLFAVALVLVAWSTTRRSIGFDRTGLRMAGTIVAVLIILPLVFVTAGFVASSTLIFSAAATALRGRQPSARTVGLDIIVGALFSLLLFMVFTRGLGVSLPGFPAL
jgi:putative tricarboxylic transport membrane protein